MSTYKTYSNTQITKGDAVITVPWIIDTKSEWYKSYGGYHTGLDILATEVYSMHSGTVIQVGKDENDTYAVTLQYSGSIITRYKNLKTVYVKAGDYLYEGGFIGTSEESVHFEYATRDEGTYLVRIDTETYYKHNPEVLFNGTVTLKSTEITEDTEDSTESEPPDKSSI